jgi:hypothetical protein
VVLASSMLASMPYYAMWGSPRGITSPRW